MQQAAELKQLKRRMVGLVLRGVPANTERTIILDWLDKNPDIAKAIGIKARSLTSIFVLREKLDKLQEQTGGSWSSSLRNYAEDRLTEERLNILFKCRDDLNGGAHPDVPDDWHSLRK